MKIETEIEDRIFCYEYKRCICGADIGDPDGFFTRVVFTRMLSEGYVGINGLFTDILNILSLSELGVGTAITYALYRPIAENDISKQRSLCVCSGVLP